MYDDYYDESVSGYDELDAELESEEALELVDELAGEEVGRIFRRGGRGRRKRRRRILGAIFGGPAGAIGAIIKRRKEKRAMRNLQRARAAAPAATLPGGKILPAGDRIQPFGLGSVTVPAGGSAVLSAVVQNPFQPDRLLLSGSSLADIRVDDIKIGSKSQLSGVDPVPAELYDRTVFDAPALFDPAKSGLTVTVELTEVGGVNPQTVSGAMTGTAGG